MDEKDDHPKNQKEKNTNQLEQHNSVRINFKLNHLKITKDNILNTHRLFLYINIHSHSNTFCGVGHW
jgi:hypothetical protein